MQFSIFINQSRALEWGLNAQQAMLFAFLYNTPTWAESIDVDGVQYCHVSKGKVIQELPLLTAKPDTVYRLMKQLQEKGVIRLSSVGKKTLIAITQMGAEWNLDTRMSREEVLRIQRERAKPHGNAKEKRDIRLDILERDNYICQACGVRTDPSLFGRPGSNAPEVDHIIPRSKGGGSGPENLQCLCGFCNRSKHDMSMEEFMKKRQAGKISDVGEISGRKNIPFETGKISSQRPEKNPTDHITNNQKTNNQGVLDFSVWPEKPSDQILADWKKLRRAKKSPITPTVINKFAKPLHELHRMGYSVDTVMAEVCSGGWTGLKTEWFLNRVGGNSNTAQNVTQINRPRSLMDEYRAQQEGRRHG